MARTTQPNDDLCRCSVTTEELTATLGLPPEAMRSKLASYGVTEIASDWAGRPAVSVEVAAEVFRRARFDADANSAKNDAYRKYQQDCEAKATVAREAAMAKARAESDHKNRRLNDSERDRLGRRDAAEAAEQAEQDALRRGNPVSFTDFEG